MSATLYSAQWYRIARLRPRLRAQVQDKAKEPSLVELLQSLHHAYASLADSRDLNFTMDLDDAVPDQVVGDALRVRQILSNYLHNALKFTPENGVVVVRLLDGGGHGAGVADIDDDAVRAKSFSDRHHLR